MGAPHNPFAFPFTDERDPDGNGISEGAPGMSLRDYFAGQALPFVNEVYPDWQLKAWFGDRGGVTREEIRAKASYAYADAMLAERQKGGAS